MTTSEVTNQSRPPSAGDAARSMTETAKEEGKAVVGTAKEETARLTSSARAELHKQGDEQTHRMAERVRDVADQLEGLKRGEAPTGTTATVLDEVGTRAQRIAARLDEGGIDAVTSDVKQFARQRPGLFLLGAFGLGIVAGRTLRNADTHALAEAAKPTSDQPEARQQGITGEEALRDQSSAFGGGPQDAYVS
jgi:vacuolar-type H+-ATPase subunit H